MEAADMLGFRHVTRLSLRGWPHAKRERTMPRLVDWALDCSIYLYRSEADANRGERTGGSGFLFGVPMDVRGQFIYAVSNWHVVRQAPVIRLNTTDDKFDVMPLTVDNWFPHPDSETDLRSI